MAETTTKAEELLTPEQHAEQLAERFKQAYLKKYAAGQKEHGGKLWEKPTIKFMAEEILDQWSYYAVLDDQLESVKALLSEVIQSGDFCQLQVIHAFNILNTGNKDGIKLSD